MSTTSTSDITTYALSGLHCQACVGRVTRALEPLAEHAVVSLSPMQVTLNGARVSAAELARAVALAGAYTLTDTGSPQVSLLPAAAIPPAQTVAAAQPVSWIATYRPLLLLLAFIVVASVLVQTAHGRVTVVETMRYFMAGFFLAFSFFKLLDLSAFATAYASYDLLAARWPTWGKIYPLIELALGLAYLSNTAPTLTHSVTLVVMGFSALGVIQAVASKRQIQCACLGAVFKLPMSTVTIVEDVGMVAMAAWMLLA